MSRASSMPEMISMGWPSASRARSRNACLRRATRSALVPTTRTLSGMHVAQSLAEALAGRRARAPRLPCSMRPSSSTPGAEPHHLAQAIDDDELAVRVARDHHVETVGAEIDRRQDVRDGLRSAARRRQRRRASGGERGAAAAGGLARSDCGSRTARRRGLRGSRFPRR